MPHALLTMSCVASVPSRKGKLRTLTCSNVSIRQGIRVESKWNQGRNIETEMSSEARV